MSELIVITSASGKQNQHLIPRLYSDSRYRLRLVAGSDSGKERLSKTYPNAEVTVANMLLPTDCRRIVAGATTVYHVGPTHVHETAMGYNMIDATKEEAGHSSPQSDQTSEDQSPASKLPSKPITTGPHSTDRGHTSLHHQIHFIYSSVLNTQLRKLLNHDCKRYVEEYLQESSLPYTILNPSNFFENFQLPRIIAAGLQKGEETGKAEYIWPAFFDPSVSHSLTAHRDLGQVAAKVIVEREGHFFAQYLLAGTLPTAYTTVIDALARELGEEVRVQRLSFEEMSTKFVGAVAGPNTPEGTKEILERIAYYYDRHGLKGNPGVMGWLLGRETTGVEEFVRRAVEAGRKGEVVVR